MERALPSRKDDASGAGKCCEMESPCGKENWVGRDERQETVLAEASSYALYHLECHSMRNVAEQ